MTIRGWRGGRWWALALAVPLLAGACTTSPPSSPGPSPSPSPTADPAAAERQYLRERLGGLAGMLIGDDPMLASCVATDQEVPGAGSGDPDLTRLISQAEAVRASAFADPPGIELLDPGEFADRVASSFGSQWDDERIDQETRTLTALGAIPPGTDLATLRVDVFAAQVSGYFLGGSNEIAVRAGDPDDPDRLDPLTRAVLVHELEHALSHANVGRPADHQADPDTADARRAAAAVVEGSATVTMLQYAETAYTPAEQTELATALRARADAGGLADYSPYLRAEVQFPYTAGRDYLCQRWLDGGWAAVDAAYTDPPASTAEVLFPERHGEQPRSPAPLAGPGDGWERVETTTFGAAELSWLLAAPGGDPAAALPEPRERVAGWDGGELTLWTDGPDGAVGLSLVDRGSAGVPTLCDTIRDWYTAAFPASVRSDEPDGAVYTGVDQHAALHCSGDQVRLGIGPTATIAAAIL